MRVVGEIPHPVYKITLFFHDERWTIQVANGPYQVRTSIMQIEGLETVEDIHAFVNEPFLLRIRDLFEGINHTTQDRLKEMIAG